MSEKHDWESRGFPAPFLYCCTCWLQATSILAPSYVYHLWNRRRRRDVTCLNPVSPSQRQDFPESASVSNPPREEQITLSRNVTQFCSLFKRFVRNICRLCASFSRCLDWTGFNHSPSKYLWEVDSLYQNQQICSSLVIDYYGGVRREGVSSVTALYKRCNYQTDCLTLQL